MHVLCALTSPRVQLTSYSSLKFSVESPPPKHTNRLKKCSYCNVEKSEGIQCCVENCKVFIHLSCVFDYAGLITKDDSYGAITTTGLLDKNEGLLLSALRGKPLFPGLTALLNGKSLRKDARLLVCDEHNTQGYFLWCNCNQEKEDR